MGGEEYLKQLRMKPEPFIPWLAAGFNIHKYCSTYTGAERNACKTKQKVVRAILQVKAEACVFRSTPDEAGAV